MAENTGYKQRLSPILRRLTAEQVTQLKDCVGFLKELNLESELGNLLGALEDSAKEKLSNSGSVEEQYRSCRELLGGDAVAQGCMLQSMRLSAMVEERLSEHEVPWEQDCIYRGLDQSCLLRDSDVVAGVFHSGCQQVVKMLQKFGLPASICTAPMKGPVRAATKVNVKYFGDVCQLTDVARATIAIHSDAAASVGSNSPSIESNSEKDLLNLSHFKPVRASSDEAMACRLVDGGGSEWFPTSEDPQWIVVDLAYLSQVHSFQIQWWGDYGTKTSLKVLSSPDGKEYTVQKSPSKMTECMNNLVDLGGWSEATRFVRVELDDPTKDCFGLGKSYGIRQLRVMGVHTDATLHELLPRTYEAFLGVVQDPPPGWEFLHFDDRFLHPMKGGYMDLLFLVRVQNILAELQVNYDNVLRVKNADGHTDYEIRRLSNDLMLEAAQKNDASSVGQHLAKGAAPNYTTAARFSALAYAALHGNVFMAEKLLSHGADPFLLDSSSQIPLARAVALEKIEVAEVIIRHMQLKEHRQTLEALCMPARVNLLKIWAVAKQSCRQDVKDLEKPLQDMVSVACGGINSALGLAARANMPQAASSLVSLRANPNAIAVNDDGKPCVPLDLACEHGSSLTVKQLVACGSILGRYQRQKQALYGLYYPWFTKGYEPMKSRILEEDLWRQFEAFADASKQVDWVDMSSYLEEAASAGAAKVTRSLLRREVSAAGLPPDTVKKIVLKAVDSEDIELLALLRSRGANFVDSGAAVHLAAWKGLAPFVSSLAAASCPLDTQDDQGNTSVHMAAKFGRTAILKLLHENKCDLGSFNSSHQTPLHLATLYGHSQAVTQLIGYGASLEGLMFPAISSGNLSMMRLLAGMGCDMNPTDRYGETPLHAAIRTKRLDVIEGLLELRANPEIKEPDEFIRGDFKEDIMALIAPHGK